MLGCAKAELVSVRSWESVSRNRTPRDGTLFGSAENDPSWGLARQWQNICVMRQVAILESGPTILGGMDVQRAPVPRSRRRLLWFSGVGVAVVGLTLTGSLWRTAAPKIDGSGLFIDTVRRGQMVRSVQGPGQLVPEEVRWVTATATAHVERVLVRPGASVEADTVLADLSNPDLELQALEAQRQLAAARAALANLDATSQRERLAQQSVIAGLRSDAAGARRREAADLNLMERGFLSTLEMAQTTDRSRTLASRLSFEEKRLLALERGMEAQGVAQRSQLQQLGSLVAFRKSQLDHLHVRAGMSGVLQELVLQAGQSVIPGAVLAKVARPDRLKAEIRIPEIEAKDLALGQDATVDLRSSVVAGKVTHIDPNVQAGTVRIEVSLEGALPKAARPDLNVEASIEIERVPDAVYVGRPTGAQQGKNVLLYKLAPGGDEACRTPVQLGKISARSVEVLSGLTVGDRVVLSDMSQWDHWDRLRIR